MRSAALTLICVPTTLSPLLVLCFPLSSGFSARWPPPWIPTTPPAHTQACPLGQGRLTALGISLSSAPAASPWKHVDKLIPIKVRCQIAPIYCTLLYLLPSLKFAEYRLSGCCFHHQWGGHHPTCPLPCTVIGPLLEDVQLSEPDTEPKR